MTAAMPGAGGGATSRLRQNLIMATAMAGTAVYVLDIFVVALALPRMQGTFSAAPDQVSWVATAFVLGTTVMIIASGWLSTRVGTRLLLIVSIAAFMVLSLLAANAETLEEEVLWRFLMGMAGAPIQPMCQVVILNTYPREEHGWALAIWGLGVMSAPVIALPLAGIIIDLVGWPGVFYMNMPVAGLALLGTFLFVPRTRVEGRQGLDWFGLILLILVFGLLQFVLGRGARVDWFDSTTIVVMVSVSALSAYLFVVHILTARNPLIPPGIFRDRNFTVGLFGTFAFGSANMMVTILLPIMLRNQLGYPIELVGIVMVPRTFGTLIGQWLIAILITRVDARHLIAMGAIMSATSTWIMSGWSLDVSPWLVVWPAMLHGTSGGFLWVCFNSLVVSTLDARYREHGVPFYYLSFNVGFSFGVAGILAYWTMSAQANYAILSEHLSPFNRQIPESWDLGDPTVAAGFASEIARQAGMVAFNNAFFTASLAALLIIPIGYMFANPGWRRGKRGE